MHLKQRRHMRKQGTSPKHFDIILLPLQHSKKRTQRLSLLLQKGSYDLIAPLEKELLRSSNVLEDSFRYGLAYAHFQRGLYQEAKDSLVGITDPKVFRQSIALQKAIYRCIEGGCL